MSQHQHPMARLRALSLLTPALAAALTCGIGSATATARAQTPAPATSDKPKQTATTRLAATGQNAPSGAVLTYRFQPGETHRYKVKALFDGHFPPFAQPGSEPIHMVADLVYITKVGKQTAAGTEVSFSVDTAELSLITHEVTLDQKIDPNDLAPFPVPLEDIQNSLNTTAIIRPDGTVASVVSGAKNVVRVNIGFDLRKLFLLLMPVTFPQTPVHPGDSWPAQEGVLGIKPGSTRYTNNLVSIAPGKQGLDYSISQNASSKIDDTLDEQGNSTSKAADIFSTLKGDVTLDGAVTFSVPAKADAGVRNTRAGQMMHGTLHMQVNLQRKTTKKDAPAAVVASTDGDFDVTARLAFRNADAPARTQPNSKKAPGNGVAQTPAQGSAGGGTK